MNRRLLAIFAAGAVAVSVYLAASSGPAGVQRVAVCPVRLDDECLAAARDAGIDAHRYERVRFPVFRTALPDGGVEIDLPRALARTARCVEVVEWADCSIDTCAAHPGVCALWDAGFPLRRAAQRGCLRAKFDAGLMCPYANGDPVGDRNVSTRARRSDPAQCEEVECSVFPGDDPDEAL